jgi:hypothetical protein
MKKRCLTLNNNNTFVNFLEICIISSLHFSHMKFCCMTYMYIMVNLLELYLIRHLFFPTLVFAFSIQSCRSCYATQHLCQRSFYKIFNKDENKSLISNQFSLKNYCPPTSWRTMLRR